MNISAVAVEDLQELLLQKITNYDLALERQASTSELNDIYKEIKAIRHELFQRQTHSELAE